MVRAILCILVVLANVVQIVFGQAQNFNPGGGPPPARVCGESLMLQGPSRMGYPPQGYMQRQMPYNPPMQHQYQRPARPIYSIDVPPPYRARVKRQVQQLQPAFVPDMSHLNQGQYYPPQQRPPQHMNSYLPPRQPAGIRDLLMALDPPDAPDMPEYPLVTTPTRGLSPGAVRQGPGARVGPGAPQPGPQMNMPANANTRPQPPPQRQQSPLYINRGNPPQQLQAAPLAHAYPPGIPVAGMGGVDTVCFCTDTQTCLLLEGNMEVIFMAQCSNPPPPTVQNGPLSDVCCCVG